MPSPVSSDQREVWLPPYLQRLFHVLRSQGAAGCGRKWLAARLGYKPGTVTVAICQLNKRLKDHRIVLARQANRKASVEALYRVVSRGAMEWGDTPQLVAEGDMAEAA